MHLFCWCSISSFVLDEWNASYVSSSVLNWLSRYSVEWRALLTSISILFTSYNLFLAHFGFSIKYYFTKDYVWYPMQMMKTRECLMCTRQAHWALVLFSWFWDRVSLNFWVETEYRELELKMLMFQPWIEPAVLGLQYLGVLAKAICLALNDVCLSP